MKRKKLIQPIKKENLWLVILSGLSFVAFLIVMDSVIDKGRVLLIDTKIAEIVINFRTTQINTLMILITSLGDPIILSIVSLVVLGYFVLIKRTFYAETLIAITLLSGIFIYIMKNFVSRARPEVAFAIIKENDFSFPSGHALFAVCFYGVIVFFIFKSIKNKLLKSIVAILGISLILLIAFSRIYLGVHWTSDVITSLAIGTSWISLIILYWQENKGSAKI